ncbi:MAG: translation elongation factor Ts [Rhodospirillales bacterium]
MAEVTATLVKELRERTGAGMMDCKRALIESAGDIEAASDWLRKKGLSAAAKKAGRTASEGLVGVCIEGHRGAVVEVNAETDFVARNEQFREFVRTVARLALHHGDDVEALKALPFPGTGRTVAEQLTHMIATIGENMNLRRAAVRAVDNGFVGSYVHNAQAPGLGKIAVLVGLESGGTVGALEALGKQLAMHVAAANPQAVSRDDVGADVLERERAILIEQARAAGKAEAIVEKMVQGRLSKFYEEICLLDQTFVVDGETKVAEIVEAAAQDAGAPIRVRGFVRFALGEGIEKKGQDFAAEVAKAVGG